MVNTVFLIRHGESQSNAGKATTGPENVEITQRGQEQARAIAEFLKSYPIDLIVTSPYRRAKQTAELTTSIPLFHTVEQVEWKVQEFTYLSSMHQEQSTVEDRRPLVDAYWEQCQPSYVESSGSESFAQFIERVQSFILSLQTSPYETIAVFSHEQFINAVLWLIKDGPIKMSEQAMRDFKDFLKENTLPNGIIVQLKVHHNQARWSYEKIMGHLEQPSGDLIATPSCM